MLDILISFDSTGSMYPALSEVRRRVSDFIDTLFDSHDDLHMGILAHGDYIDYDRPYLTKHVDLTNNKETLKHFVNTVERTNGGDSDEAYELVLHEAQYMSWRKNAKKVFILIGDAEPHEPRYRHGRFTVHYKWEDKAYELKKADITVYPVQALAYSDGRMYKYLSRLFNTPHLKLDQFSQITQLLTAISYKQDSDDRVTEYAKNLQDSGQMDRSLAYAFNLLLNADNLISGISSNKISSELEAVHPARFQMLHVDHDIDIKQFVQLTGATFKIGKGFYELTKTELVQEHKEVVLRDSNGDMYSGEKARELIGLPYGTRGKVRPMRDLGYSIFIQSTSPNRKLIGNTRFLYEESSYR